MVKRCFCALIGTICLGASSGLTAADLEPITGFEPIRGVDAQPLVSQVKRLTEALEYIGSPLSAGELRQLRAAYELPGGRAVERVQEILAPRVLLAVHINPESRVKVARGPAKPELVHQGWRSFLVRVHNEAGVTAQLAVRSPNSAPLHKRGYNAEPPVSIPPSEVGNRWADIVFFDRRPLEKKLSSLLLEYRILEVYSRDVGKREARVGFNVGQGTQDIGFRSEVSVLFDCVPSVEVVLDVRDFDGSPTMASFVIKDGRGRVYPSPSRRLAPDFFFHAQIYRAAGESVHLPPGEYDVEFTRGPEYLVDRRRVTVPDGVRTHRETFKLRRWIHAKAVGWYSGDHHVHAAGCSHYESPTQGVTPKDMMRHLLGEDVNVGCVLSWGPCWYFQKQYFEGKVSALSQKDHLMRYDVEVSGFPSDHAGHLCLLRLKEDDYPGTTRIDEWPSWDLPILRWGKEQGAVVGFSHSGWGLKVETADLPNYVIPPFDGIGANEYIVDVTHGVVDFISSVDTPYVWELNIWYHTLNCGYRTVLSGETDFPCIYGERVGLGRVYCKLDGELDFDRFCDALKKGRSYVGDGRSHLMDFQVDGVDVGSRGSEVRLSAPGKVTVRSRVAAYLDPEPLSDIRERHYDTKPYWHIERARIEKSRRVPLELVVNGEPRARKEILADGTLREVSFDVTVEKSSWVALRVLPSSHTNPVYVLVEGKPIRASKRSARWCLESVDQCWSQKVRRIRESERPAARAAYDFARAAYRKILSQCDE
ncbi:MAG: CehA/McbA family metallohydrolase [Planctomycetota bacterium]|nr:CehA/McbA family metallohydrolase [Planctomycetota bacterium]